MRNFPNSSSENWRGYIIIAHKVTRVLYVNLPKKLKIVGERGSLICMVILYSGNYIINYRYTIYSLDCCNNNVTFKSEKSLVRSLLLPMFILKSRWVSQSVLIVRKSAVQDTPATLDGYVSKCRVKFTL